MKKSVMDEKESVIDEKVIRDTMATTAFVGTQHGWKCTYDVGELRLCGMCSVNLLCCE
jgi:hypothetical protein